MEFTKIVLPPVTQECLDNRVDQYDRCSENFETRIGDPNGVCDEAPHPLSKAIVDTLYERTYAEDIPYPLVSPGYEVLQAFDITGAKVGQMFDYWMKKREDPRSAICDWMIDNFDVLESMIPREYPRVLKDGSSSMDSPLSEAAIIFASFAVLMAIFACVMTFVQRNRLAIRHAQIEFLCILLTGLLLVSIGAILVSVPPSDGSCVAAVWMVNVGYSLELVPLIVKMAAFYRLMRAAKKMRHVQLRLRSLFGAVFVLTFIVVVFVSVWSVVDPPRKQAEFKLTHESTEDNEYIVTSYFYCGSKTQAWYYSGKSN